MVQGGTIEAAFARPERMLRAFYNRVGGRETLTRHPEILQ